MSLRQMRVGLVLLFCALSALAQRQHDPNKVEVLTLPLSTNGFVAPEVSVPNGKYVIEVLNRSTLRNLHIEIDKLQGNKLSDRPVEHTGESDEEGPKSRFVNLVQFTPGTYRLRITGRPAWACVIHVK